MMGALAEAQNKAQMHAVKQIVAGKDAETERLKGELIGAKVGIDVARTTIGAVVAECASRLVEQKRRILEAVQRVMPINIMDGKAWILRKEAIAAIDKACEAGGESGD